VSQIMKTFLGVFLIMFMVVTSSGVLSGFMTVVEAQNLHAQIINELEDSDYDSSVAQTCFEKFVIRSLNVFPTMPVASEPITAVTTRIIDKIATTVMSIPPYS
jgi:hypothetical protein